MTVAANARNGVSGDAKSAAPEQEPAEFKRLADMPADLLASRFVGSLIMAKGNLNQYDAMTERLITDMRAEFAEDIAAIVERAAEVCEAQYEAFASPEYATGQPLSSFGERFACKQCAEAIRALLPADTASPQEPDAGQGNGNSPNPSGASS